MVNISEADTDRYMTLIHEICLEFDVDTKMKKYTEYPIPVNSLHAYFLIFLDSPVMIIQEVWREVSGYC